MSDKLTAKEYREALILVLTELEDLDLSDTLGTARRVGELRAHVRAVVDLGPAEPVFGLRGLRRMREVMPNAES